MQLHYFTVAFSLLAVPKYNSVNAKYYKIKPLMSCQQQIVGGGLLYWRTLQLC